MEVETHGWTEKFDFVIFGDMLVNKAVFSLSILKAQCIVPEFIFVYIYRSKNQAENIKSLS